MTVDVPVYCRTAEGGWISGSTIYAPAADGVRLPGRPGLWRMVGGSHLPAGAVPVSREEYDAGVAAALAEADRLVAAAAVDAGEVAARDYSALLAVGIPPDTARRLLGSAAAHLED